MHIICVLTMTPNAHRLAGSYTIQIGVFCGICLHVMFACLFVAVIEYLRVSLLLCKGVPQSVFFSIFLEICTVWDQWG